MEEIIDTNYSIPNFFLSLPQEVKPLSNQERKWILQRSIFSMVNSEDTRYLNLGRYKAFLNANKLRHNETNKSLWLKTKDKEFKKIPKMNVKTFGFFTCKLSEQGLFEVESICRDKVNRKESPTLYIMSLRNRRF